MNIFADNSFAIGNTPLVQLRRVVDRRVTALAKIERHKTETGFSRCSLYPSALPK